VKIAQGDRKLSVALVALVSGFVLALLQRLTADYAEVVSVVVGSFMVGNSVEHYSKSKTPPEDK